MSTYASAIGIILVVFYHSHDPSANTESHALARAISWAQIFVFTFIMPLFFAISGFLYAYTNPPGRNRTYLELVRGKMVRLLLPYAVISSVVFPIKCFLSRFALRPLSMGWRSYVESLLIPDKNPIAFFWFLPALFCIFLAAPVLLACFRLQTKTLAWGLKLLVTAVLVGISLRSRDLLNLVPNVLSFRSAILSIPFFWVGMWTCHSHKEVFLEFASPVRKETGLLTGRTLLITAPVLITFDVFLFSSATFPHNPSTRMVLAFLGVGAACCCALLLANREIRVLSIVGVYTYQIYLLSWFFQIPVQIVNLHFLQGIPMVIPTSISFLVGIIGPLLCVWFVLSYTPRIKILIGL